jgi:predicted secreted acid phosphatase
MCALTAWCAGCGYPRMTRVASFFAAALLGLALGGCAGSVREEPANLGKHKEALIRYHASGDYERGLAAVAEKAGRWIEKRAARRVEGERLAVVFDVDETVLSNWANMTANDFGYISDRWHAWVASAQAASIAPVKTTYETARRAGVAVIFLTGRRERDRDGTTRNLQKEGMGEYAELIMQPNRGAEGAEAWATSAAFKTAKRKALVDAGWVIIANIGDQQSDLVGGYAEKTFKLPNPFYVTE